MQVCLATALCWSVVYVALALSDTGRIGSLLGPINARLGDAGSYVLTLVPPLVTCGAVLATQERPDAEIYKYSFLAAGLTAIGTAAGFFFVFIVGVGA